MYVFCTFWCISCFISACSFIDRPLKFLFVVSFIFCLYHKLLKRKKNSKTKYRKGTCRTTNFKEFFQSMFVVQIRAKYIYIYIKIFNYNFITNYNNYSSNYHNYYS